MALGKDENLLQQIRQSLTEEDKLSQAIGKSHLLQRDPVVAASKPDKKSINRLKDEHLDSL